MNIPLITEQEILNRITTRTNPFFEQYYAFYSSWFGGIVQNPQMMLIPMDDHMVHRGDGVFEVMKSVSKAVYLMDEHLDRLLFSAQKIHLKHAFDKQYLKEIILKTLRVADKSEALIRVYLSRGPGNFSVNPYDSIAPQLYVAITQSTPFPPQKHQQGATLGTSSFKAKTPLMAQIKSCNYLLNVLMKKEAVDRQLDFILSVDEKGFMTEGATENIMIVDENGILVHPPLEFILKGTMMIRAFQLAEENGIQTNIRPIHLEELKTAREIMITGTSLNVLGAVKFDENVIGDGTPGKITQKLNNLLLTDIQTGKKSIPF